MTQIPHTHLLYIHTYMVQVYNKWSTQLMLMSFPKWFNHKLLIALMMKYGSLTSKDMWIFLLSQDDKGWARQPTAYMSLLSVFRESRLQLSPRLVYDALWGNASQPTLHLSPGDKKRAKLWLCSSGSFDRLSPCFILYPHVSWCWWAICSISNNIYYSMIYFTG